MKDLVIKVKAEFWNGTWQRLKEITVQGNDQGIFVNDQEAEMSLDNFQLKLKIISDQDHYLVLDDNNRAGPSIKSMYKRLKPFNKILV
jgi:hypothetical protein